jgi:uncharacterized protein involved in propanediol utilization
MTSGLRDFAPLDMFDDGATRWPDPRSAGVASRTGIGTCLGHHGELLQGQFPDAESQTRSALVTLPCPLFRATAAFDAEPGAPLTADRDTPKAAAAARLTLRRLGLDDWGGRLEVRSDIPRGRGMGSSTADVVAAARAVAGAAGRNLSAADLAAIAVAAESASDSLMYDRPTLFAQRDGVALEVFGRSLPPFTVVGADLAGDGPGVDTLAMPLPRYTGWDLAEFQALRGAVRRALILGDPVLLAQVATASTRINQRHRPLRGLDGLLAGYGAWGVLGVQVAHSGTVVGLLCRSGDRESAALAERGLRAAGGTRTWSFDVGHG